MLSNAHRSVNGKQVPSCSLRVNKQKRFSVKSGKTGVGTENLLQAYDLLVVMPYGGEQTAQVFMFIGSGY